jgi:hypothetical protein
MDQPETPKHAADSSAEAKPQNNLHSEAVHELYKFAVTNFSRMDPDHDGFISKDELNKTLEQGTFKGAEATKVAALRNNIDDISALNDDGWFTGSKGISAQDLVQMDYLWEKQQGNIGYAERIRDFGVKNFDKLDFDKRGQILGYEVVAENGDGCYSPQKHSIVTGMPADDQYSFSLLHRNLANIGHSQGVPDNIWMCKPYQFTTQYGISKNELAAYPSAVAHRPMYSLVNKIDDELK